VIFASGSLVVPNKIGVPATKSNNPLSPVHEFDAHGNEIYYRSMKPEQYEIFERTGKMPPTGETFISPSQAYAASYDGTLVRITVKPNTTGELQSIGISANEGTAKIFPNLPTETSGWTSNNALFKLEGS